MGTVCVETLVALYAGCGLPAFNDVIAVTVGAAHGDEYHRDLLYERPHYDIYDGASANLKHYPRAGERVVARYPSIARSWVGLTILACFPCIVAPLSLQFLNS
jgi:hypothetical protein